MFCFDAAHITRYISALLFTYIIRFRADLCVLCAYTVQFPVVCLEMYVVRNRWISKADLLHCAPLSMTSWISKIILILKQPLNSLSPKSSSSPIIKAHRLVHSKFESSADEGNATKELIKVKRYRRLRNVLNGCSLLKPLEWSTVPPEKLQPCVRVSGCQGPIFRSEAWASAPPLSLAHPLQVLLHKTPLSSFLYMGEGLSSNWISLFVWLFLLVCSYSPHLSVCLFFPLHPLFLLVLAFFFKLNILN